MLEFANRLTQFPGLTDRPPRDPYVPAVPGIGYRTARPCSTFSASWIRSIPSWRPRFARYVAPRERQNARSSTYCGSLGNSCKSLRYQRLAPINAPRSTKLRSLTRRPLSLERSGREATRRSAYAYPSNPARLVSLILNRVLLSDRQQLFARIASPWRGLPVQYVFRAP